MTRKEAIQFLDNMRGHESGRAIGAEGFYAELCGYHVQALNIAIKALSQQTDTLDVLRKIREEISHITDMEVVRGGLYIREFEAAEIIDKYIAQYTEEQA